MEVGVVVTVDEDVSSEFVVDEIVDTTGDALTTAELVAIVVP